MTGTTDWTEQARRLAAGLSGVLGGSLGGAFGGAAPSGTAAEPHPGADAASDCRWCPLCQTAAMLRGERPELSAAVADVLATAAEALRSVGAPGSAEAPGAQPAAGHAAAGHTAAGHTTAGHTAAGHAAADDSVGDPDLVDLDRPQVPGHEAPAVQHIDIAW
jgi:hypothetical protein